MQQALTVPAPSLLAACPSARLDKPARCRCTGKAATTLAQTLACPLEWWPVPGGWEHLPASVFTR
jgi:hypothetical protein